MKVKKTRHNSGSPDVVVLHDEPSEIFHPAGVLPEQLPLDRYRVPERRLMLVVLSEAIRDAEMDIEDAREWMKSTEREWPFYFVPLCETLGFDPNAVLEACEKRWLITRIGNKHPITRRRGYPCPEEIRILPNPDRRTSGKPFGGDTSSTDTDPKDTE